MNIYIASDIHNDVTTCVTSHSSLELARDALAFRAQIATNDLKLTELYDEYFQDVREWICEYGEIRLTILNDQF